MFYFILFIWGLYGVAALLNPVNKNNMFNILIISVKPFLIHRKLPQKLRNALVFGTLRKKRKTFEERLDEFKDFRKNK